MICKGKKHYQCYSTSKTFKEVKPRKQTEQRDMSWDARVPFSLSVSGWYFQPSCVPVNQDENPYNDHISSLRLQGDLPFFHILFFILKGPELVSPLLSFFCMQFIKLSTIFQLRVTFNQDKKKRAYFLGLKFPHYGSEFILPCVILFSSFLESMIISKIMLVCRTISRKQKMKKGNCEMVPRLRS